MEIGKYKPPVENDATDVRCLNYLPTELRLKIWRWILPRNDLILYREDDDPPARIRNLRELEMPLGLQICRESREETQKHYSLICWAGSKPFFFNPRCDSVFLEQYKLDFEPNIFGIRDASRLQEKDPRYTGFLKKIRHMKIGAFEWVDHWTWYLDRLESGEGWHEGGPNAQPVTFDYLQNLETLMVYGVGPMSESEDALRISQNSPGTAQCFSRMGTHFKQSFELGKCLNEVKLVHTKEYIWKPSSVDGKYLTGIIVNPLSFEDAVRESGSRAASSRVEEI